MEYLGLKEKKHLKHRKLTQGDTFKTKTALIIKGKNTGRCVSMQRIHWGGQELAWKALVVWGTKETGTTPQGQGMACAVCGGRNQGCPYGGSRIWPPRGHQEFL